MISSTVTVTALVFAVFIKCPMFSNEQCDKAPYGPVGAARQPHSHASHSPNLFDDGFTVSLVQCIFIPNKNWQTPKNYSRCQALRFMPWADRRCRGAGGQTLPPGRRRTPPRRCCRLGAGRNAAEMKFLSSFDLYVLSSLSPSLLLMEIILNKLETEFIELL